MRHGSSSPKTAIEGLNLSECSVLTARRRHLINLYLMETQVLEARVLSVVEAVLRGRQVEDDRVELKAVWPEPGVKVARQIAGHVNAAAGEPVLWIIGLDEKRCQIGSTSGTEPSNWWKAVKGHFAEVAPEPKILRVPDAPSQDVFTLRPIEGVRPENDGYRHEPRRNVPDLRDV